MKAVMISIQPYWVFLIIAKAMGWEIEQHKELEVRKNYPKAEDWNKVAKIYCSKDKKSFDKIPEKYRPAMKKFLGKVIGEFVCDNIGDFSQWEFDYFALLRHINLFAGTNHDYKFLDDYLKGQKKGYGWHISDLVIYDEPKELSDFWTWKKCNSCKVSGYESNACCFDIDCRVPALITRPPQSWCYVEGVGV